MLLACLARGYNREAVKSRKKLIKIAEIFSQNNPVNIIPKFTWKVSPVITAVYNNINAVKQVIQRLKREDFGISIVISGIISEIRNIIKEMGLNMHTVHLSLGIFGKKELLPHEQKILEITTMCGHHCISTQSVEYYINLIREGKISIIKAAQNLAKPCVCGIFNTSRAIEI
ncbi:MAG: hypothetical protein ACFFDX_16605, partial [Candidatus Odinarchaeota archaeon]